MAQATEAGRMLAPTGVKIMSHRQCITRLLDLHGMAYIVQGADVIALELYSGREVGEWHVFGPAATLGDVRRWLGY